jgi:hypothetical protein
MENGIFGDLLPAIAQCLSHGTLLSSIWSCQDSHKARGFTKKFSDVPDRSEILGVGLMKTVASLMYMDILNLMQQHCKGFKTPSYWAL